jgi:hypothetical protein
VTSFVKGETGKRSERSELAKALEGGPEGQGALLIANLDRLARNVAFIVSLMDAGRPAYAPHSRRSGRGPPDQRADQGCTATGCQGASPEAGQPYRVQYRHPGGTRERSGDAPALRARGVKAPAGRSEWQPVQVSRPLAAT